MKLLTDDQLDELERRWCLTDPPELKQLIAEVREFRKMKAQLAEDHPSVSKTPYVDLVYGNDSTGVLGDPTKPFATYAFAEQALLLAAMDRSKP